MKAVRTVWPPCYRIIPSRFPPIDLFERAASLEDLEDNLRLEAAFNAHHGDSLAAALPPGLTVAHQLVIGVWDDGGLSVEGPVTDRLWCLAALANAKDAVRAHRSDRALVVPGRDVEVPPPVHPLNLAPRRA